LRLRLLYKCLKYYSKPCEPTFSWHPLKPLRYFSPLATSPFLKTGSSLVIICYSTLSLPLTLRAIRVR